MRLHLLVIVVYAVVGCDVSIPNGLFACGQPSDCPSGYFCWASDNRCYDSKEPPCEPKSCEEVLAEFADLGITIECGSLPDGCDGAIECGSCPPGTVCGANGQSFVCGCQENTCASYGGGAQCGVIPTRCGGAQQGIYCGSCLGALTCVDNQCVCPAGANCDLGCGDRCGAGEVCVDGQCCSPTYPCAQNPCSPPGGLPDGCGGVSHCPPCSNDESCVLSDNLVFECLGDCTCKAQGIQCGSATICGAPTLCGTCADNGFGAGYRCESGRCVCEDQFEDNDSFDSFALVCGDASGVNCMQEAWSVDLEATLHSAEDVDYYALRVLHASTPIVAQAYNGSTSNRILHLTYLCPDGSEGLDNCSGSKDDIQGIDFCISEGNSIGLERRCDSSTTSGTGTVLVGVAAREFRNDCDPYGLKVFATYQYDILDSD